MPIKTILILLVVLIIPGQAMALGLGKLQTASTLNQPFEGEIPLLSLEVADLDSVKVTLASKEAFSRVNVDYTEPYLNFLVEVNWPKGQIVREFAVLLDVR